MKHLFVPYELALLAKEKGFDEPCIGYLTPDRFVYFGNADGLTCNSALLHLGHPTAPLYQQLVDWFREKHGRVIMVLDIYRDTKFRGYVINNIYTGYQVLNQEMKCEHYEALTAALTEAFKLI